MSDVLLTDTHGRVLLITLNRPKAKNSVNSALGLALVAAIEELDTSDDLTAGVLTGADGGFSAGMDLKAFATEGPPNHRLRAVLPSRFPCWYHAAKAAAFAVEGLQPKS